VIAICGGVLVICVALWLVLRVKSDIDHEKEQDALSAQVPNLKREGDELCRQRRFRGARDAYDQALKAMERLDKPDRDLAKEIRAALASNDVKLGSDPSNVHFEGKWIKKKEKEALLTERFRKAQLARGLVEFRGEWMKAEERDRAVREEEKRKAGTQRRGQPSHVNAATDWEKRLNSSGFGARVRAWALQFGRSEAWVRQHVSPRDTAAEGNRKLVVARFSEDISGASRP